MFYCRENELRKLNNKYEKGEFECIVIYGRRRVGKTSLINKFCEGKPVIFFSALNAAAQENLSALSSAIYEYSHPLSTTSPVFRSFDDAFEEITKLANQERIIFVIDEYPYLAKSDESISSKLQHLIDHTWSKSNLYLILCGSSMSFMEYQVLGYESPLYGRRTAQFKIEALTYRETATFNPSLTNEQQALIYGITGGIPHYINKLGVKDNIDEALLENLFDRASYLFEEPENLLKQELREPAIYNSVISAIANGASHQNEISTKVGLESGVCAKYLKVLLDLGIIKKETPINEKPGRKTIYTIGDNFFRFWYRFIPKNMAAISSGRMEQIYSQAVKKHHPDYMGLIFEKMCRQYLLNYANNLPIPLLDVGQWWGTDFTTKKEIQIDIVGTPVEGNEYIIGSCKFKNERIGIDEFELLQHSASIFNNNLTYHYYIFSKSGFTNGLIELGKQGKVTLITLDDLF